MIKVNVEVNHKLWHKKIKNPQKYFNTRLKKINKLLKFFKKRRISFTILLTNSFHMRKLNKKYRNINKSTDVLSFPFLAFKKIKSAKEKKFYIGDIAVCYEIINFRSKKKQFNLEFDKVWTHGLLHLIGYNHIKNQDFLKMNRVEKKIINLISF